MKKLVLAACLSTISFPVFALDGLPGIYAGFQAGIANAHTYTESELGMGSSNDYGADLDEGGIRAYAGYDWSSMFATEIGYAHLSGTNSISDQLAQAYINAVISPLATTDSKTEITQNAVDLLGKVKIPIPFVHPYVKAGGAYVNTGLETTVTSTFLGMTSTQTFNKSTSSVMPVVGAGLESNIFAGLNLDLSWMRYQHVRDNTEDTDFYMLGISYHFA